MKRCYIVVMFLVLLLLLGSCRSKDRSPQPKDLGTLSINLVGNKMVERKKEAII